MSGLPIRHLRPGPGSSCAAIPTTGGIAGTAWSERHRSDLHATGGRAHQRTPPAGRSIIFAAADGDARAVHPYWRAETCAAVIPILPSAAQNNIRSHQKLDCRILHHLGPEGLRHILLVDGGRSLQIVLHPGARLATGILPVNIGLTPQALAAQIVAIRRLTDFLESGRLRPALYPPPSSPQRLLNNLRALDGHMAGASFRQIAVALWGEKTVAAEWGAERRPIYFQVRRTIARGYVLMRGGYRRLLR